MNANTGITLEKKNRIAYVTLDRPDAMNAINGAMMKALIAAWTDIRDDPDAWLAIITGAGDKAFCAGNDLKERGQEGAGETIATIAARPDIPLRRMDLWKPVICAINGIALGSGFELALSCDIRIAADHARMGLPEVKRGLIPGGGGTARLCRLVPFGLALEMLMTGDMLSAAEARQLGLVNKVVPLADLMRTAEELAARINENGPLAVRGVKEIAYRSREMTLPETLAMESLMTSVIRQSEDAKEGPRAFVEKRKPAYRGK
ncbi:MAG: enoyl-CoA hydratase/isomerase family protein [Chloroflexi bacterium]|nr:enoyl-CoA hydratase/isomerase family protein [Chloroflexota bacterium]